MALESQEIDVPFTQGVDTKSDAKLTAKLARLENYMFVGGTLQKRPGSAAIAANVDTGGSLTTGEALDIFRNELIRFSGGGLYGYSSTANEWVARSTGQPMCTVTDTPIAPQTSPGPVFDHATIGSISCIAYRSNDGYVRVVLRDDASGTLFLNGDAPVYGDAFVSKTPMEVRVVAMGTTNFLVFFSDVFSSPGKLCCFTVTASPAGVAPASLVGSVTTLSSNFYTTSSTRAFDAIATSTTATMVVFPTSITQLTAITTNASGVLQTGPNNIAVFPTGPLQSLALCKTTNGQIFCAASEVAAIYYFVFQTNFTSVLARTTIASGLSFLPVTLGMVESASNVVTLLGSTGNTSTAQPGTAVLNNAGVTTAWAMLSGITGFVAWSRPFMWQGQVAYGCVAITRKANATTGPDVQMAGLVVTTGGVAIARFMMGKADNRNNPVIPVSVVQPDANTAYLLFAKQTRSSYISAGGSSYSYSVPAIERFELRNVTADQLPRVDVGGNLHAGGGLPRVYDGSHFVEDGFNAFPDQPGLNGSPGAGSLGAGTYQVRALYSWTDNLGKLHRSAPSVALSFTATASSSQPIAIPTLIFTGRTGVQVEVYRTAVNGTVFYRESTIGGLANSTAASVSFTCTMDDTTLQGNEPLYTTGGIYDNIAPPPYQYATAFKTRLVIAGLEDPYEVRFSGLSVAGEALRFNEAWGFRVPAQTGAVSGLAVLDDKLVIFTTQAIYVVMGDGPNFLGQGGFAMPQAIATDTGCVVWQSIVSYPDGVLFLGNRGICQLSRSLEVEYIGADVEAYSSYTFRCARVVGAMDQVRFQCDTGSDVSSGVALVWDYFYKQWSVFTSFGAKGAAIYNNAYTRLRSDGAVFQEGTATTDAGSVFFGTIETAWLKVSGLQGFQRVRWAMLLGQMASNCAFTWEAAYDYDATYNAADLVTVSTAGTWTVGKPFQARRRMRIQKCEAVRFRITETAESTPFGGISLTGLALEVAVKRGHFRGLSAGKSF